jgi:hypothetical protein
MSLQSSNNKLQQQLNSELKPYKENISSSPIKHVDESLKEEIGQPAEYRSQKFNSLEKISKKTLIKPVNLNTSLTNFQTSAVQLSKIYQNSVQNNP